MARSAWTSWDLPTTYNRVIQDGRKRRVGGADGVLTDLFYLLAAVAWAGRRGEAVEDLPKVDWREKREIFGKNFSTFWMRPKTLTAEIESLYEFDLALWHLGWTWGYWCVLRAPTLEETDQCPFVMLQAPFKHWHSYCTLLDSQVSCAKLEKVWPHIFITI